MEQGEKNFFFEVGVFKQGDVVKQMFQKGSLRMYLNLCKIFMENRVYVEVILSLQFSIAFFNMDRSSYRICWSAITL